MFKVLIVEDEMLVRIGLKNSIDWDSLGMKVIGDVSNGQAAWEFYGREKPDLILTDIKMPVMDGMKLISKIREYDDTTRIIILTCYEEFDLVHKALKLGVSDYILKLKMSTGEMESVLRKALKELKKGDRDAHMGKDPEKALNTSREDLFYGYIFFHQFSQEDFAARAEELKLRLNPKRLVMAVMEIQGYQTGKVETDDDRINLMNNMIMNILNNILAEACRGEAINIQKDKYMMIFSFNDIVSENKINEILLNILTRAENVVKGYTNAITAFSISSVYNGYRNLAGMYRECTAALEYSYFMSKEKLIKYKDIGSMDLLAILKSKLNNIPDLLRSIDENYCERVSGEIEKLSELKEISKKSTQDMFFRWVCLSMVNLKTWGDDLDRSAMEYARQMIQCAALDENVSLFNEFLQKASKYRPNIIYLSREVAEAVAYIKENYRSDISLEYMAEKVNMSSNYLSSLFKKELGLSFVEYVSRTRIDMAKKLFLSTHLKSYEIAKLVGFEDESYFSRIFKKITLMRPNEFRRKCISDIPEDHGYEYNEKSP